ncbi:SMC-Scp complex subunit ScpB [Verrucomicrobiales bacterium]|nr:SMC-Scp complex subunit ScpB [Verrucomicrobiales bacterium]
MQLKQIIEALLIASPDPLTIEGLQALFAGAAKTATQDAEEAAGMPTEAERKRKEKEEKERARLKKKAEREAKKKAKAEGKEYVPPEEPEIEMPESEPIPQLVLEGPVYDFAETPAEAIAKALEELVADYDKAEHSFTILERAEGWKIFTRPAYSPWLQQLFPEKKPERLSAPALETLAIVAYRQPITKSAIEAVRGVSCDGVMQKLLDKNIVRIAGRAELPGRPLLYETTDVFFEHFGIRSVDDLPNAAELRTVKLPEPEPEPVEVEAAPAETAPEDSEETPADEGGAVSPGEEEVVVESPAEEETTDKS